LRVAFEDVGDVDAVAIYGRRAIEAAEEIRDVGRWVALGGCDEHVLAVGFAAAAFVEHAEGLADAGSVAEEDFETPARLATFIGLDPMQKLFGGWGGGRRGSA